MPNQKSKPLNSQILTEFNALKEKYELKDKCGIFFKLERDQNPLDITGVLDLMKYKFKEWDNINIFCYSGKLFKDKIGLVIGSYSREEALNIIRDSTSNIMLTPTAMVSFFAAIQVLQNFVEEKKEND